MNILTADGSYTKYDENFGENYHSTSCGSFSESLHKHIIPSFKEIAKDKETINILDICFGLGFNTLVTIWHAKNNFLNLKINIFSPEINGSLVKSLVDFEYPKEIENKKIINEIAQNLKYEDERYNIEVKIGDAREILKKCDKKFDIIYQDAFSPDKNRASWTAEYFAQIKNLIKERAIITTYSRSTAVRLGLYENGFNIYEISSENIRKSTIASNFEVSDLKKFDMEKKIKNAPNTRALRDAD